MLSVVIPLGPEEHHSCWLDECLASVYAQTLPPDEILIIDDGGDRDEISGTTMWHAPWRLGISGALNCGVGLAKNECVFILASDDWLDPDCLAQCMSYYEKEGRPDDQYMNVGIYIHHDEGSVEVSMMPATAGMVTKTFWRRCGGFPNVPVPDSGLHQLLSEQPELGKVVLVGEKPLYHCRYHKDCYTRRSHALDMEMKVDLADFSRKLTVQTWRRNHAR